MLGCWVCNPLCGRCHNEAKSAKKCPVCGTYHVHGFYKDNKCNKCGADLGLGYQPVHCAYSGLICALPCKRHKIALPNGELRPCRRHTPVRTT